MKAISLWQPWATLLVRGIKVYETRDWMPPERLIGQRIAIHAALKPPRGTLLSMDVETYQEIARRLSDVDVDPWEVPRGCIVGTAVLADVFRSTPPMKVPDVFGDYSPGRAIWRMADPIAFEKPIPMKGRQGWWEVGALADAA